MTYRKEIQNTQNIENLTQDREQELIEDGL